MRSEKVASKPHPTTEVVWLCGTEEERFWSREGVRSSQDSAPSLSLFPTSLPSPPSIWQLGDKKGSLGHRFSL